jgi:pentatricopeptide repeat protein
LGQWKETTKVFREMTPQGPLPNIVTWNTFMAPLCKHGRGKEAADIFDLHDNQGPQSGISYRTLFATGMLLMDALMI